MSGRGVHRAGTVVLSLMMAALGVAFLAEAALASGSVVTHALLGALFLAGGIGRLAVERRRGPHS
jgi:hypothetical protein